jgi:hypothetical protein
MAHDRIQDQFDPTVLDEALSLLRDHYGSAERSVFFLESETGISAIAGITNQRDCFSHLVTLLKNPQFTPQEQAEQLTSMKEHLRRAVLEPPMLAVADLWRRFEPLLEQYREVVVSLPDYERRLPGAPSYEQVRRRSAAIIELRQKSRSGKGENRWDPEWEVACADAVQAFRMLNALKGEVEDYIDRGRQIRERDQNRRSVIIQVLLAVGGIVIGIVVSWLL